MILSTLAFAGAVAAVEPSASPTPAATLTASPAPSAANASPEASPEPAATPALPPCPLASAKLLSTIDTKVVKAGDRFAFATAGSVTFDGKAIPAGTQGSGIVATMDHSKSHGETGYLVLEARYLELAAGSHIPAMLLPGSDGHSDTYVRAGNSNAPGFLGYVPYVGTAASVYDFFHHGKDAALVAGAPLTLVLGDGLLAGTCAVTPAS